MKKQSKIILLIGLILVVVLICGIMYVKQIKSSNNGQQILLDTTKEIVYSYIEETIDDNKDTESSSKHIYQIPKVNINSSYAIEINEKIKEQFESEYNISLEDKKNGNSVKGNIKYKYYINNDILSLVVANFSGMNGYIDYAVFNINCKNGQKVSDNELITSLEISTSSYNDLVQRIKDKLYTSDLISDVEQIGIFNDKNMLMAIFNTKSDVIDASADIIDINKQTEVNPYELFDLNV